MNREAAAVFLSLIGQGIRMTPVFICLKPKHGSYETIAAASVYIWVIMIAARSLFRMPAATYFIFNAVFSAVFFSVLMVFFEGTILVKIFLYISAWFFAELLGSLDAFFGWVLRKQSTLSYEHICLILAVSMFLIYAVFVWKWLKERVLRLLTHIAPRDSSVLIAIPCFFLILLFFGSRTIFRTEELLKGPVPYLVFYLVFCLMALILYVLVIADQVRILDQNRSELMLTAARRINELQREHYNQIREHQKEIRIIRHDFRHHIHAIEHMDDAERREYLKRLQEEMEGGTEVFFCENAALNSLLAQYAAKAKAEHIRFDAQVSVGDVLPVDDLTLCVIIGNLLQNAVEASEKCQGDRFIRIYVKSEAAALRIMVENRYDGTLKREMGRLLSTKKDGGLGMESLRRLIDHPGDDLDYYANGEVFTSMVYLAERVS